MSVIRAHPRCPKCSGIIHAIYKDQSDLPSIQQIIGDTFIKWNWEGHKCELITELKHELALVIWNEFIVQTSNGVINFSFNDLEKRIEETLKTEKG